MYNNKLDLWNGFMKKFSTFDAVINRLKYLLDSSAYGALTDLVLPMTIHSLTTINNELYDIIIKIFTIDFFKESCYETLIDKIFIFNINTKDKNKLIKIYFSKYKFIDELFTVSDFNIDILFDIIDENFSSKIDSIIKFVLIKRTFPEKNIPYLNMVADKLIPKNYKFTKPFLGLLFHLDDCTFLEKNNLINIGFLEYCYSDWVNESYIDSEFEFKHIINSESSIDIHIADIRKNSYLVKKCFNINDLKPNKFIQNDFNDNNIYKKWINKLEFFFEKKVIPTEKILYNVCLFLIKINGGNLEYIIDVTDFVNLMTYYGYIFTTENAIFLLKNNFLITDVF